MTGHASQWALPQCQGEKKPAQKGKDLPGKAYDPAPPLLGVAPGSPQWPSHRGQATGDWNFLQLSPWPSLSQGWGPRKCLQQLRWGGGRPSSCWRAQQGPELPAPVLGEPTSPVRKVSWGRPNPTCLPPPQGQVGSRSPQGRDSLLTCRCVLEEACGGKVWDEVQQEKPSAQLRDRARCHSRLLTAGPKLMQS